MTHIPDAAIERLSESLRKPALPLRYILAEEIGRGGMGVVWAARDRQLERDVAIKVLAEHADGEAIGNRLAREARVLARLEHPGIVAVHDSGVLNDGRPWYVMRLVRGERLDEAAGRFPTIGDAIRVMLRLAETIAFAHAQGILHRDLTPRNVMLGPFGEVLVLDWGVAREGRSEPLPAGAATPPDSAEVTGHGTVLGTPGYMSPEQALGLAADERSDVYGLGAILRDLLAARPGAPPPALAAIVTKAMAPEPAARYPTALALRDDLVRFLDGDRVVAYRERPLEAIIRLTRPYQTVILLVLAYLAMRMAVLWWRGV
jgi:serine/threonine protein kinase